jgi:Flp pilus assembly protein TadG
MNTNLKQTSKLTRRLGRDFSRDTSGAVALMLGLAIVPMVLAAGLAVDFYRAGSAKAQVQASLDASVLAGAAASPNSTEAERTKAVLDAFEVNLRGGVASGLKGTPDVSFDNGRITVSYNGDLPTTLLSVGGFNDMTIGASSTATMNKPARAEIAMVLDYSGSMTYNSAGKQKYITMREAAIDMVNGLDRRRGKQGSQIWPCAIIVLLDGDNPIQGQGTKPWQVLTAHMENTPNFRLAPHRSMQLILNVTPHHVRKYTEKKINLAKFGHG